MCAQLRGDHLPINYGHTIPQQRGLLSYRSPFQVQIPNLTKILPKSKNLTVIDYFRIAMDLWLSTSTLDTWAHGQSMIHGAPEFILSKLNLNFFGPASHSNFVNLGVGEAKMEADLSQRICQDMVFRFPSNFI